jgi:hypothetical protein
MDQYYMSLKSVAEIIGFDENGVEFLMRRHLVPTIEKIL